MPIIRHPDQFPATDGPGWHQQEWASSGVFGEPVPIRARRYRLDRGASGPGITLTGQDAFAYVIGGTGAGRAGADSYLLATESVLWLGGSDALALTAGQDGLDVLVAESTGEPAPAPPRKPFTASKAFAATELPHLVSTRDTRDRMDLVTDDVPVGATQLRADRIVYHPGDTAAAHYHSGCHHVFCMLTGSGLLYTDDQASRLEAGMSALVGPGEVHWFEDDRAENFSFVEFWAPPPTGTVWTVGGDQCTWATVS
jgi:quercetin dioxygenase-like cupin family protein